MNYRKISYIISLCFVPLMIMQWHFKMIWLKIDHPGWEYFSLLSIAYFPAYYLGFKSQKRRWQILPMWMIWIILNVFVGFKDAFLSIDLYIHLIFTSGLLLTKKSSD